MSAGARYDPAAPFVPQVGLTYVRGCEVEGMLDEGGRVIEEGPDPRPVLPGERRTFRVWLDCNQYRQDLDNNAQGNEVSRPSPTSRISKWFECQIGGQSAMKDLEANRGHGQCQMCCVMSRG